MDNREDWFRGSSRSQDPHSSWSGILFHAVFPFSWICTTSLTVPMSGWYQF